MKYSVEVEGTFSEDVTRYNIVESPTGQLGSENEAINFINGLLVTSGEVLFELINYNGKHYEYVSATKMRSVDKYIRTKYPNGNITKIGVH